MSLQSERQLSMEELKSRNSVNLMKAKEVEQKVTLTEQNWIALIQLIENILEEQQQQNQFQQTMLSAEDAKQYLTEMEQRSKELQTILNSTAEWLALQVGNLSEMISSDSEKLTTSAKQGVDTMIKETQWQISQLTETVQQELSEAVSTAKLWMVRIALLTTAASALSMILFALVVR